MKEKQISERLNLSKIPFDQKEDLKLQLGDPEWLKDITQELEELTDTEDENYEPPKLVFNLTLSRKKEQPIGDHLMIWGDFDCHYTTPCVRCLTPTHQHLNEEVNMGFIPGVLENTEEFKDAPSAFISGQERDLYFHDKGFVELLEALREQVFVNADFFPLHSPDCKGLCPQCGVDRNIEDCPHQD